MRIMNDVLAIGNEIETKGVLVIWRLLPQRRHIITSQSIPFVGKEIEVSNSSTEFISTIRRFWGGWMNQITNTAFQYPFLFFVFVNNRNLFVYQFHNSLYCFQCILGWESKILLYMLIAIVKLFSILCKNWIEMLNIKGEDCRIVGYTYQWRKESVPTFNYVCNFRNKGTLSR